MSGWTDERVEQLKKLWLLGWSASQIAKELGAVTRNAVIGKIHRLDLVARQTPKLTPPALSTFPSTSFLGSKSSFAALAATTPITIKSTPTAASPYQTPTAAFAELAARGQGSQGSQGGQGGQGAQQASHSKASGKLGGGMTGGLGGLAGSTHAGRTLPDKPAGLAAAYGGYGDKSGDRHERPLDRTLNQIGSLMGGRNARQCQWPVGDPRSAGFHFCGCAPLESQPYCSEHVKLAYQPSGKSRRVNVGGGDLHASGQPDEREISIRA